MFAFFYSSPPGKTGCVLFGVKLSLNFHGGNRQHKGEIIFEHIPNAIECLREIKLLGLNVQTTDQKIVDFMFSPAILFPAQFNWANVNCKLAAHAKPEHREVIEFAVSRSNSKCILSMGSCIENKWIVACLLAAHHERNVLFLVPSDTEHIWRRVLLDFLSVSAYVISHFSETPSADVVICSYERSKYCPSVLSRPWTAVFVDEAHALKDLNCVRSIKLIPVIAQASASYLFSNAPIQNKVLDLFPLLHMLHPISFCDRDAFSRWYAPNYSSSTIGKIAMARMRELGSIIKMCMCVFVEPENTYIRTKSYVSLPNSKREEIAAMYSTRVHIASIPHPTAEHARLCKLKQGRHTLACWKTCGEIKAKHAASTLRWVMGKHPDSNIVLVTKHEKASVLLGNTVLETTGKKAVVISASSSTLKTAAICETIRQCESRLCVILNMNAQLSDMDFGPDTRVFVFVELSQTASKMVSTESILCKHSARGYMFSYWCILQHSPDQEILLTLNSRKALHENVVNSEEKREFKFNETIYTDYMHCRIY